MTGVCPTVEVAEQKKRKIVWIVSDCEPESRRQDYVTELKVRSSTALFYGTSKCVPVPQTGLKLMFKFIDV